MLIALFVLVPINVPIAVALGVLAAVLLLVTYVAIIPLALVELFYR